MAESKDNMESNDRKSSAMQETDGKQVPEASHNTRLQTDGTEVTPQKAGGSSPILDAQGNTSDDEKWAALKNLLVGPEDERIIQLEEAKPDPVDLADVLPEAVRRSSTLSAELAEALRPTVEQGLLTSARKNPDELAEAIYPVLGPAIRRSIRAALQSSVQSLNVALENSFSPQGLRWRMEARRTGKSFSEVVLLHSLKYRVEQVYWIHKETGVLLQDVSGIEESQKDPDMVSGMLAAIQDFVQDSFQGAEEGELEQIEVSGFRVLLAQGPTSGLAALVRGIPPEHLSDDMNATLETLHRRFAPELENFTGDVAPLESAADELEGLLGESAVERGKKGKAGSIILALLGLLAIFWLWSWVSNWRLESKRNDALAVLASEPGYWVQGVASADAWSGLRDPLARSLPEVLGFDPEELEANIQWQAFQSLEPTMILRRAKAILDPPSTVDIAIDAGHLVLRGEAPVAWVRRANIVGASMAGLKGMDRSELVSVERKAIEQRSKSLNGLYLPFGNRSTGLDMANPSVRARLDAIAHLDGLVSEFGGVLRIELNSVLGQDENYDRALAAGRLDEIRQALAKRALKSSLVEALPEPGENGARGAQAGVRIQVHPILTDSP